MSISKRIRFSYLIFRETFRLEIVGPLEHETHQEQEDVTLHQFGDTTKLLRQGWEGRGRVTFRFISGPFPHSLGLLWLGLTLFGVVIEEDVVFGVEIRTKLVNTLASWRNIWTEIIKTSNYRGDLNTDHLHTGNICMLSFLKFGFQMVSYSNG